MRFAPGNERCVGADCPAAPARSLFQFRQTKTRALPKPATRCHFCRGRLRARHDVGNSVRIRKLAKSQRLILEATARQVSKTQAQSDARFRGRAQKEAGVGGARKSFPAANHLLARIIRWRESFSSLSDAKLAENGIAHRFFIATAE